MTRESILGIAFAMADSEQQASFINESAANLRRVCITSGLFDGQCCHIVNSLDANGKLLVKRLAEFIAVDEVNP